ncbi:PIN domain-containing protein [Aquamicrobium sp. LC103]|uniref:PIN domain-containing protein n=1 Tax=Aquamicrobium sp. LC103 TaxID=1120658 RepID=UPI000B29311D|nr:PIN domain-containing protein [Aquamicrobium sp. LC103]
MIVLDTNVISEVSKLQPDVSVRDWFKRQELAELFLCGPVVMEQAFGAEKLRLRTGSDRYVRILEELLSEKFRNQVLNFDGETPLVAGRLRAAREREGRPTSVGDAMIAAICLAHGAARDAQHARLRWA